MARASGRQRADLAKTLTLNGTVAPWPAKLLDTSSLCIDSVISLVSGSGQEDQYLDLFEFLKMNTKTADVRTRVPGSVSVILFDSPVHAASATHLFMKGCMPVVDLLNLKFNMQDTALVASVSVVPSTSCLLPYSILHGEPYSVNDILKKAQVTGMTGSLSVVGESDFVDLRRLRAASLQSRPRMFQ